MAQFSRQSHRFVLPLLVASCTRGEVDLGQGTAPEAPPRGARCVDSTVIDSGVVAHNQDEIAALTGCTEIHGDLFVRTFQGADLTPLSSLRSVEGQLLLGAKTGETPNSSIGSPAPESEGPSLPDAVSPGEEEANAVGWLTSLAGLEGLESVGGLTLYMTSAPDLHPLSNLRSLDGNRTALGLSGQLGVFFTHELKDLTGLEQALGLRSINFQSNSDLESLEGLNVPYELSDVAFYGDPALSRIDAFASLGMVTQNFVLDGTSVESLDALSDLSAPVIMITDNGQLVDASALDPWSLVTAITIQNNPLLKTLSSFSNTIGSSGSIVNLEILGNDSLESVTLDFSRSFGIQGVQLGQAPYGQFNKIEISANKGLISVQSPGALTQATSFHVSNNDSLVDLDLSSFRSFSDLTIDQNPALTKVDIPSVQSVDTLVVTNNPQLPTTGFAALQTFSSTLSGNADGAPAPVSAPSGH